MFIGWVCFLTSCWCYQQLLPIAGTIHRSTDGISTLERLVQPAGTGVGGPRMERQPQRRGASGVVVESRAGDRLSHLHRRGRHHHRPLASQVLLVRAPRCRRRLRLQTTPATDVIIVVIIKLFNKKHLKNVGPIRHNEPPHANSPDVASGTVAHRLRIDVHDNDDNDNNNNDNDNA